MKCINIGAMEERETEKERARENEKQRVQDR